MKVLVACEESQKVTIALRERGVEAYSCDLEPCRGGNPEWHFQCDVMDVLNNGWKAVIAFPPCTDLASSGARWFEEKRRDGRQQASIDFFMEFTKLDCEFVAIENPVGIMSSIYRKPDQIIHPYMFGHPETKATCLWLKGFPKLVETDNVYEIMLELPRKERNRIHYLPPGDDRSMIRSETYSGIANAMADQWQNYLR